MKTCFFAAFLLLLQIFGQAQAPVVRSCGVKILVPDLGKARDFYCNTLGFGVLKEDNKEKTLWLDTKEDRQVVLQQYKKKLIQNAGDKTCISFTLQVNNLDSAQARLRARGVRFVQDQKRAEGVGFSLHEQSLDQRHFHKRYIWKYLRNKKIRGACFLTDLVFAKF
jgi:catechol 2,3-dioxygenase-like lactoylglutathione lyase family enzyme